MKHLKSGKSILATAAVVATVTLGGCGGGQQAAAPQLPPPPVVVVPPQPGPPGGASPRLAVPPLDAMGVRRTVNYQVSPAQITWNLRSAYNVAALNCLEPQHAQIVVNYRAFLRAQEKKLTALNKALDQEFKDRYGAPFVRSREAYMTQVYNYFALPPTLPAFCDAALAMSIEAQTVPSADLDAFAARSLPTLDRVFLRFFLSYDQYRADLAAWQAKYYASSVRPPAAIVLPPPTAIVLPPAGATPVQAR